MKQGMASVVYHQPRQVRVEEMPVPRPPAGWTLIKVSHTGICGTDLNIFAGAHPRAKGPLILGHEISGTIAGEHPDLPPGAPVTVRPLLTCGSCEPCRTGAEHVCAELRLIGIDRHGGMAEYVAVPAETVHALPDGVPLDVGALMEPLAVGVHAVRQSGFVPGDTALVFGAGPIGMCVAVSLSLLGAGRVIIAEPNAFRRRLAEELGFETVDPASGDVQEQVLSLTGGNGADCTFDCAGHPAVAEVLAQVTRVRGKTVIVAAYKKPAPVDLLSLMFKEIQLLGVRVYTPKDFHIAARLLTRPFPFHRLITHILPVEQAHTGFDLLMSGGDAVKVLVRLKADAGS